jgi:hypothetical protein
LLSFSWTKCFANLTSNFAPCQMTFCNAVRKVSNWNAGGVPFADMLLLLWWTIHFVLSEQDGTSHSCWQVSKICIVFGYGFQHIPFKWMHHTFCDIVWRLNINSAPFMLQSYIQYFLQKALISIWMPSLPTHHWLCVITSLTSLQHIATAPTNTWYHYLLVLHPSKSCCHHGKREVPWLWQVVCSDWTTPDIPQCLSVSDGGTCLPAETHCPMLQLQQWHRPLNRNNSCCFHPWGWWWYVYWHVYQRCQEAMTHRARRQQPIQRNLWRHWHHWWFWYHDTKSLRWCWSNGSWLAFQRVHLCGSQIGSCCIQQSWSASSWGTATPFASHFCTSIQHNSATRKSHIFACWWCTC